MGEALIFALSIKNYLISKKLKLYMADKKDSKDKKFEKPKHNSGEIGFGTEVIIFVVAIFVIWMLMGKPKSPDADKPFIKQNNVYQVR